MRAQAGLVKIEVNWSGWKRQVVLYSNALGISMADAIRVQARLLVETCYRYTPPQKGKKQGETAVERDIRYLFKGRNKAWLTKMIDLYGSTYAAEQRTKDGRVFVVDTTMMRDDAFGMYTFHQARRDSRGRVRNAQSTQQTLDVGRHTSRDTMIVPYEALENYLVYIKRMVGRARSGWAAAMLMLGAHIPDWVARHGRHGDAYDRTKFTFNPHVIIVNRVPYIVKLEEQLRIVRNAIQWRQEQMPKQIAAAHRQAKKRAGFS